LALVEYLVRNTGKRPDATRKPQSHDENMVTDPEPAVSRAITSDLLALGRALNAPKAVQSADFERVPDHEDEPSITP
jgi:hypothetical protein